MGLVRTAVPMVKEAAVALISAAAEACQDEDFGRYYDAVMPFLMEVSSFCHDARSFPSER